YGYFAGLYRAASGLPAGPVVPAAGSVSHPHGVARALCGRLAIRLEFLGVPGRLLGNQPPMLAGLVCLCRLVRGAGQRTPEATRALATYSHPRRSLSRVCVSCGAELVPSLARCLQARLAACLSLSYRQD